ncbi:MSMEG_0570 family nitrogen starvation response protein [Nocardia sp. 004]|uniref:MSMEG_0570 family nitrogen starvation response protein n=1 Tax=Nocardia sp. 004 TaxID=3385978 RepID=UPI0039A2C964
MPEMTFDIQWPDGHVQSCYSPSLVIHDYLETGRDYAIDDFLTRVSTALHIASDRVAAKFGYACSSARQTLDAIESTAAQVPGLPTTSRTVRVLSMSPSTITRGRS